MNAFIVQKTLNGGCQLPNDKVIAAGEFVNRMARCGFDDRMTAWTFRSLVPGGSWQLDLNRQQRRLVLR